MKLKIEEILAYELTLSSGSVKLTASKRSTLFKGLKLKEGDEFELTLKAVKKTTKK